MITCRLRSAVLRPLHILTVACLAPLLAAAVWPVLAAHAEMTDWASNEGGRMRIVALPPEPNGKVRGVLQIEPKPDWITYWKEPGDSGIPPQLVVSNDSRVHFDKMSFPVPKQINTGGLRDIGYDAPVSLPFQLTVSDPGKPVAVTASAFVGLCKNICIPFQADFSLSLTPVAGTPVEEAMVVGAAEGKLPSPPSDDFRVTGYAVKHGGKVLQLSLRLPKTTITPPQVILSGPEGHVFVDETKVSKDGDNCIVEMPIGTLPKGYAMQGQRWGILVVAGERAMETSLAFD